MRRFPRTALALLVGCTVATIASTLQYHFKAGSFPDLVFVLLSVPGDLIATLIGSVFHDRGTLSPEFLWRPRLATATLFGGLAYWTMRQRKLSN